MYRYRCRRAIGPRLESESRTEPSRATTRERETERAGTSAKRRRWKGTVRGRRRKERKGRTRHTPPLPCRTSANAWARFHKRFPRGWVLDNALVTSNTDTSRGVYRGLEESARSGPLILLEDRMRPDPDPSLHSNS